MRARCKDIEDIIAVLDGRPSLPDELLAGPSELLQFVVEHLSTWLAGDDFPYAVDGYLRGDERAALVLERARRIVGTAI